MGSLVLGCWFPNRNELCSVQFICSYPCTYGNELGNSPDIVRAANSAYYRAGLQTALASTRSRSELTMIRCHELYNERRDT